ncbi:MAG: S8 family serine peptidase, partial [Bacteroidia bacterium]|nr:S8 family serine peptidase [Bacteroidia bacterium]
MRTPLIAQENERNLYNTYKPFLSKEYFEKNKIIVKFKEEVQDSLIIKFISSFGFSSYRKPFDLRSKKNICKSTLLNNIYEFVYKQDVPPNIFCKQISNSKIVEYAEPCFIYHLMDEYLPNDPLLNQQSWLNKIEAKAGWNIHRGNSSVVVAIVDAGIHFRHPDLVDNVYYNTADPINGLDDDGDGLPDNHHGWDLIGESDLNPIPDNDPEPLPNATTQFIGHGTWVAGVASATPDNQIGIAGTGFNCKFLPIKVSADFDSEGYARILRSPEAIFIAAEMGASIINCSFGSVAYSRLMQDVIKDVTLRKNALVVAAAGNEPMEKIFYPAGYDYVLSVAATDANDVVQTTRNLKVDVSAPGYVITTSGSEGYTNQGVYTSFSAPIVSGIAGIVRSYLPGLTAIQTAERIRTTSKDISLANPDPSFQNKIGRGQANLLRALTINGPAVRVENFTATDKNGNPIDPGDTISLICRFINYLSPAINLNVSVSVLNTSHVSLIAGSGNIGLGSLNTLASKTQTSPFRFAVSANAPPDLTIQLRIRYQDGLYEDFEVISFIINRTFLDIATTNIRTSTGSTGKWGFNDSPSNTQGLGWIFEGRNLLYQGGLIIGKSTLQGITVADNLLATATSQNNTFQPLQLISGYFPGPKSDKYTVAFFSDYQADSANKININIKDETYAFDRSPNDNYAIKRYVIRNRNPFLIQNLYVGLYADWDVNPTGGGDNSGYDSQNRIPYVRSSSGDDSVYACIINLQDF